MCATRLLQMMVLLVALLVSSAAADYSDPNQYWKAFRQAVVENDIKTVMKLTYFPFKVRGVDDSDPVLRYGRNDFKKIYNKLLNQVVLLPSGGKVVSKTMYQLIKEKRDVTAKDYNTPDCIWIYEFKFHRVKGQWLFTWAYFEE